jgi:hypothetical protein
MISCLFPYQSVAARSMTLERLCLCISKHLKTMLACSFVLSFLCATLIMCVGMCVLRFLMYLYMCVIYITYLFIYSCYSYIYTRAGMLFKELSLLLDEVPAQRLDVWIVQMAQHQCMQPRAMGWWASIQKTCVAWKMPSNLPSCLLRATEAWHPVCQSLPYYALISVVAWCYIHDGTKCYMPVYV